MVVDFVSTDTDKYPRSIKRKNIKYHAGGTIPNYSRTIVERGNLGTRIHKYMTAHISGLIQARQ